MSWEGVSSLMAKVNRPRRTESAITAASQRSARRATTKRANEEARVIRVIRVLDGLGFPEGLSAMKYYCFGVGREAYPGAESFRPWAESPAYAMGSCRGGRSGAGSQPSGHPSNRTQYCTPMKRITRVCRRHPTLGRSCNSGMQLSLPASGPDRRPHWPREFVPIRRRRTNPVPGAQRDVLATDNAWVSSTTSFAGWVVSNTVLSGSTLA